MMKIREAEKHRRRRLSNGDGGVAGIGVAGRNCRRWVIGGLNSSSDEVDAGTESTTVAKI